MTVSFRATTAGDLPSLASFFAGRFGHVWRPEEWTWKYQTLPGEARSLLAVGEGGEILAHAGALCLPARLKKGDAGIWQLVDFAGTPGRRGLRPALIELGQRLLADLPRPGDAPWIFGFPSERHFRLGERVFEYQPLTVVEELGGPLPEGPASAGVAIETGDSCGPWAEAVWEACGVSGVRRSASFLNWRYYARPHRYYRFYRLRSAGVEGFAVFAFVGEEAWAAELWLPPGGEWYPSLLAVAADLRSAGLRSWRFWPGRSLAGLQLAPTGERRFIGCRGRSGGEDPVAAAAGFRFAMGDYDLV
ncbi:MAG TPA: hypothetical protein VF173_34015 [Thermoanaerobaculia bacterium]|nr:hypothetical protein [Thermoanaerobaculia bacterium]